jgi:hypothetical protein
VIFLAAIIHFNRPARLALFAGVIGVAIMYEPVFVAFRGSTIGQQFSNLRVVAPTPSGRLPLWKAFLRWLLKALTGFASFATMGATRRNQALHDLPFGTTVQIINSVRAEPSDFIVERTELLQDQFLPSRSRRLVVVVAYLGLLLVALGPVLTLGASGQCIDSRHCTGGERIWSDLVASGWMAANVAVCIFGWKGRLLGARRRLNSRPSSTDGPGAAT